MPRSASFFQTLEIAAEGKYVLTLENLSASDVYFTVDYDFGGISL